MATLDDVATWVYQTMLKRPNDTDIRDVSRDAALNFYNLLCDCVPFDELMTTSPEFPLVVGQSRYTIASTGSPSFLITPDLRSIASIRITLSTTNKRRLRRSSTRTYDALSLTSNGQPATYARWGNAIELNPPPDSSSYTLRFRYWSRPVIAASPETTVILLPAAWIDLIKWETLFRVYWALAQEEKAMALVAPSQMPDQGGPHSKRMFELGMIPRLWNDLLRTISQMENVDEDFSINPLVRAYSFRR